MSYFAVIRDAGRSWRNGGVNQQPAVGKHAAFMNDLAAEGFILFGGPLAGSEHGRLRALLIVNADSQAEVLARFADDPWARTGQLETVSVESWNPLAGAERLAAARAAELAP